jgi:16S rRNA (uracil1498-N3)-methyltransferase
VEYFYTPPDLIGGTSLRVEGDEFSHLTHVMRRGAGDEIRVVDGNGHAYDVRIESLERRCAHCTIMRRHEQLHEPACHVTVASALLKNGSSFDFLVEKCTEVGVSAFVPLLTERTIPRHAKTERWQKIALAAMKQCGRSVLPGVTAPSKFQDYLARVPAGSLRLILHEKESGPALGGYFAGGTGPAHVNLCVGPEGGFSDAEITLAVAAGWEPAYLGPRRLRAETAAIVAAVLVLLHP